MYVAMWAQRFLLETGQGEEDLAAVALAQRRYAVDNERAFKRRPLDLVGYLAAPFVVEPFRASDCTVEVDGACAVVVTSEARARDLRHPPAVIASSAYRAGPRSGLDIGDHLLWDDYTRNYTSHLRDELFGRAGVTPGDVQVAEIYDCFSSTALIGLEGLGIARAGRVGRVRAVGRDRARRHAAHEHPRRAARRGLPPRHEHGRRGRAAGAGPRRHPPGAAPRRRVVTSGALMDGSALVLTT